MDFRPTPKQALVLWNLLFTGAEPAMSRLRPALTPRERGELVEAGLIELERRGRARHVLTTDRTRAWAAENLDAPISSSRFASEALAGLLSSIRTAIEKDLFTLADLLAPPPAADADDPAEAVRSAYLAASGGRTGVRVRLADLARETGAGWDRLRGELLSLQRSGRWGLVLWPLDDPAEIGPEDERAAVTTAAGSRHIIYLES